MKVILIDPFLKTLTEVDHDGELDDLYEKLHCQLVTVAYIDGSDDSIFVDDEGLLGDLGDQEFFQVDHGQPLAGYGMMVGVDDEGNTVSPEMTISELQSRIKWHSLLQLQLMKGF